MNTIYNRLRHYVFSPHELEKVREIEYSSIRNERRNITLNNDKRLIILSNQNNPTPCYVMEIVRTENDCNAFTTTWYFCDVILFLIFCEVKLITATVFEKDKAEVRLS